MNDLAERPVDEFECGRRQGARDKLKQQHTAAVCKAKDAETRNHKDQKGEKGQEEVVRQLGGTAEDVILEDLRLGAPCNISQREAAEAE